MLSVMSGEYQSVVSNEWRVSVLSVMSGEYQSVVSNEWRVSKCCQ